MALKRFILMLGLLAVMPLRAENPVFLGLRDAMAVMEPVPEEVSAPARAAAWRLIGPYFRAHGETWYCRGMGSQADWAEVKGLAITRVTSRAVSQADQANGIRRQLVVSVGCEMHRSQKAGGGAWSEWRNGPPGFFPGAVMVEESAAKGWTATCSLLQLLQTVSSGASGQEVTRQSGLPAGMSRERAGSVEVRPAEPQRPAVEPTRPQAMPPIQPQPMLRELPQAIPQVQPEGFRPVVPGAPQGSAADQLEQSFFKGYVSRFALICVLFLVVMGVLKGMTRKLTKKRSRWRKAPPPLPATGRRAGPPPLPGGGADSTAAALDVIERCERLLTEAEQRFFSVLEPLVTPACVLSSKVRLADLFTVRPGPGGQAAFNRIRSKHIDFVLTEPGTSRVLCGIELDDRSHERPDRVERDRFVNELFQVHGVPLMRVPVRRQYEVQDLRIQLVRLGVLRLGSEKCEEEEVPGDR